MCLIMSLSNSCDTNEGGLTSSSRGYLSHTLPENPLLHLQAGPFIILCPLSVELPKVEKKPKKNTGFLILFRKGKKKAEMVRPADVPRIPLFLAFLFVTEMSLLLLGRSAERPRFSVSWQTSGRRYKRSGRFLFLRAEEEARPAAARGRLAERPHRPQRLSPQSTAGWWGRFQLPWLL